MCQLGEAFSEVPVQVGVDEKRTGYRWCEVGSKTGRLFPLTNSNDCWQKPVAKAEMTFYPASTWYGGARTNGGLHIFATIASAMADKPDLFEIEPKRYVLVKVRYWGDVVEHVDGARARFAEIVALHVPFWRFGYEETRYRRLRTVLRKGNPLLNLRFVGREPDLLVEV